MGCWNETCFLTRLPIFSGEPVKLLLTAPVPESCRNTVRMNGWFMPVCLPVTGHYDEYGRIDGCAPDPGVLKVLSMAKFRTAERRDGKTKYQGITLPDAGDEDAWQETLTNLASEARQGRLEIQIRQWPGGPWAPVLPQLAHAWAWNMLAAADGTDAADYAKTMGFRLAVAGPLRDALRTLAAEDGPALPDIVQDSHMPSVTPPESAIELAGVMASMGSLRLAFGPTSGSGSQNGLDENWHLEFYKNLFCHAMSVRHRYDDGEQPPFSAAVAWDGNFIRYDRNCDEDSAVDIPMTDSTQEIYARTLMAGVDNILRAMEEAMDE